MQFDRKDLSDAQLIDFCRALLLPRLIEEKMLILLRQGKITKWFSGYGQEAISVGAALAMASDEYILPMHRNLGMFTARHVPLNRLFAQFQGKASGFTKGRDRSFHFGSKEHHLVGMISHLGAQLGVADGIALADLLQDRKKATLVVTGDGGASEGDFHEALNVAAVWQLPVIFLIENNYWGLSTPNHEQFRMESFALKGPGYGIQTMQLDGNNLLEVYHGIKEARKTILEKPQPILVECMTFRIRGHEEASGTKYYPEGLIEEWTKKDPIDNFESYLLNNNILDQNSLDYLKEQLSDEIKTALDQANAEPSITSNTALELADVYHPHTPKLTIPKSRRKHTHRFVDAISDGLKMVMKKHENLILMGQDIAEYGGVFKVTEGFVEQFGKERVRNTPICESAILGAALGLSIKGMKSVVEMQFGDFVSCGFNQIVNNLAKSHYRWGQQADVVVRLPTGAGVGAGPYHSQSTEAWFFHVPGLKIVYPSTPYDAKGLLLSAIEDPNPVLYFEHKALYRAKHQNVPADYYTVEIGKGRYVSRGEDISIITYGMGVEWAMEVLSDHEDIDAEIVDLRSLLPWDKKIVEQTVKNTGKVLILHEDTYNGGISGEIAAWISEHCFLHLDAPVMRVGSLDTPVPFARGLEQDFLPKERFSKKLQELISF